MNPDNSCSTLNATSDLPHCRQRSPSGRRCRMAVSDPDSGLCPKHAVEHQKDLDQADLAASLIGNIEEFRSAADINHSLGELYKLQARNKITPRRAAVMAYTANLLLRTLPAIARETTPADDEPRVIIDMPGPDRDWPDPEPAPPTHHAPPSHPDMSWLRPNPEHPTSKDPS
jgi:hypothetical protein